MKILWVSNAPWCPTGYGNQTSLVVPRLAADGHEVAIAANYGLHGSKLTWNGVQVYPAGWEMWSNDVIAAHAEDWFAGEPGWIITLMDVWVFKSPALQRHNVACWTPVDHLPCPPGVAQNIREKNFVPIAMSEFGRRMLAAENLGPLYAPHGVDTGVYRPGTEIDGRDSRRDIMGVGEDTFVVGMVANNKGRQPSRKAFAESFLAFARFHEQHPDSVMYCHTDQFGHTGGIDLRVLAEACRIPTEAMIFPDQYAYRLGLPDRLMAALYSGMDVLLAASMGEGFGIPVVEAQACGVPVIVSEFSAQPELVGVGWLVGGQPWWDADQGAWFHAPSVEEIHARLCDAYDARSQRDPMAIAQWAKRWDADVVHDVYWSRVMFALEARTPTVAPLPVGGVDLGAVA